VSVGCNQNVFGTHWGAISSAAGTRDGTALAVFGMVAKSVAAKAWTYLQPGDCPGVFFAFDIMTGFRDMPEAKQKAEVPRSLSFCREDSCTK